MVNSLISNFKYSLDLLITNTHKDGLNYWQILKVVFDRGLTLMMQSEAEYYSKGGK